MRPVGLITIFVANGTVDSIKPRFNSYGKIIGSRFDLNGKWFDTPTWYSDPFVLSTDFSQCRFKRIVDKSAQIGLLLDIRLKKACKNKTNHEVQCILRMAEKTMIQLVPNKLELNYLPDPVNKIWLLRPEVRYNGGS